MKNEARPPKATEAKVAYHRKQLLKMFARANDAAFLQMVWAIDALQSGGEGFAKPFLTQYPPEAALQTSIDSPFKIHRWELETLIVQLFLIPKEIPREQGNLILDCSQFESMRQTINRLRALEDVEAARYLSGDFTIWGELHRIAQRQFHWQRGYFSQPQIYRYAYLYAQGQCADFFKQTYGFSMADLMFVGFGLFAAYRHDPWIPRQTSVPEIGLTEDIVQRAFPMISCSRDEARAETAALIASAQEEHGAPIPTALLPSVLRKSPLIYVDQPDLLIAPIPETIFMRVTAGLYYDILPGGQSLINEANGRFEQYCIALIDALMKRYVVSGSYRYGPKGSQIDTPDVFVKDEGRLVIVAECKATKLTYLAQFAEDPFSAARKQYSQVAKGIFQLWRFFSHVRRGLIKEDLAPACHAMVITLDAFRQITPHQENKIFAEANNLADQEGNITQEDRKAVAVCPIDDLESILSIATEDSLLAAMGASNEQRYQGWGLREILRDTKANVMLASPKIYPFDLGSVLPWWNRFDDVGVKP